MWIVDGEEELKIILLHCFPLLTCTTIIIELKIYFISLWFNGWLGKIPSLPLHCVLYKHLLKKCKKNLSNGQNSLLLLLYRLFSLCYVLLAKDPPHPF